MVRRRGTKYSLFFSLEKHHHTINNISKLFIDGAVTEDYPKIADFCSNFYKDLYSARFCQTVADNFLNSLRVKTISKADKESCDKPISPLEIQQSINQLKNNKSPGSDGLTAEFYKSFIDELTPFLLKVFIECINNQSLPTILTQGITVLIPNPPKKIIYFLTIGFLSPF